MIQDIFPKRYDNHYAQIQPTEDAPVLLYQDKHICAHLVKDSLTFPSYGQLQAQLCSVIYLFSIDQTRYFLGYVGEDFTPPTGFFFEAVTLFRSAVPRDHAFVCITGHHLYLWYRDNRFCGSCTTSLIHDTAERMLRCPSCHRMIFPRINPAVLVAVSHRNRLLLIKYAAGRGNPARYALIAGFCEVGETLEQTVRREVLEEVGLQVKNLRYYKSQPWALSDSLLMGFFCQVDGSDNICLDTSELSTAQWVPRDQVPDEGDDISLTREMMALFHQGQEPR